MSNVCLRRNITFFIAILKSLILIFDFDTAVTLVGHAAPMKVIFFGNRFRLILHQNRGNFNAFYLIALPYRSPSKSFKSSGVL